MMYLKYSILMMLGFIVLASAAEPFNWGNEKLVLRKLELRQQAKIALQDDNPSFSYENNSGDHRSVGKAVLFSALIPGSGQFYSDSYIKSALFLAIEAGAWAINISYNKKGDSKDAEFKAYANEHWSEHYYWSYVAYRAIQEMENPPLALSELENRSSGNQVRYYIPDNLYTPDLVNTLRKVEGELPGFTHRLPKTKTQQYYEMIGKYPGQFGAVWDDASFTSSYLGPDRITPRNDFYTNMRDDANRLYDIAQYGLMTALVNHVISAIDAGFTARRYNRNHAQLEMSYDNLLYKGEYVNMLGVNVKW